MLEYSNTYLKKLEGHVEAFQFPQQVHGTVLNTHTTTNTHHPVNRLVKKWGGNFENTGVEAGKPACSS